MKCEGYVLDGYNAKYDKGLFNVAEVGNGVLEITEVHTGLTIILEIAKESKLYEQYFKTEAKKKRTSGWIAKDTDRRSEQSGSTERNSSLFISSGRAGRLSEHRFYAERYDKSMPRCDSQNSISERL